jgi:putative oxidoreductase
MANESNSNVSTLTGRILLSLIFLLSAAGKAFGFSATAGMMSQKGFPAASIFLAGAIALELLGGLSVLTGYKARLGAAALIFFLIPTTLIFHNFWAFQGMEQQMQMTNFLKNVAIAGGLFLVVAFGPGRLSIDKN